MDFCPGGDLGHHLQKEKKFFLNISHKIHVI